MLTLEGGTLWGPGGKTGTVKGGVVEFQENPAPSTPARVTEEVNTGVLQPRAAAATPKENELAAGTSGGGITIPGVTFLPPSPRQQSPSHYSPEGAEEAQPVASTSTDQVAPQQPGQGNASQEGWTSEEDEPAPQPQRSSKASHKACQKPGVADLEEGQWQGQVMGKISTNREAVVKLEQTLRDLEEEGVPTPSLLAQTLKALKKDLASSIGKSRKA